MSKAKNNIIVILKTQIEELHKNVVEMDEQSLIKQLAKQKVLYNLTQKSNELQLIYSYIALSEYYINKSYFESAIKHLNTVRDIKETGDIYFFLGISYYNFNKPELAIRSLQNALKMDWVEPSQEHEKSNRLQAITYLQKLIYEKAKRRPQKAEHLKEQLIKLSHQKIQLTQKCNEERSQQFSQNYYYALAMADLSNIYEKFEQYEKALEKIKTAISMFQYCGENIEKLIEFHYTQALVEEALGDDVESVNSLKNAIELIQTKNKAELTQNQNDIYYMLIRKNIGM